MTIANLISFTSETCFCSNKSSIYFYCLILPVFYSDKLPIFTYLLAVVVGLALFLRISPSASVVVFYGKSSYGIIRLLSSVCIKGI